jgi:peptidoglycan/LPS O-acetylase OafA/YrhL
MALILQSGRYATALSFYQSRALRLFPVYWAFLLVYVAIAVAPSIPGSEFLAHVSYAARSRVAAATDGSPAAWLAAIPNLFFIGSEWARQFLYDEAGLPFLWRLGMLEASAHAVERHLVMPQIWSLGVELVFYAAAPFLVRFSTRSLIAGAVVAYMAENVMHGVGGSYIGPFQWRHMLPMQMPGSSCWVSCAAGQCRSLSGCRPGRVSRSRLFRSRFAFFGRRHSAGSRLTRCCSSSRSACHRSSR